jgi:hypothetical protein
MDSSMNDLFPQLELTCLVFRIFIGLVAFASCGWLQAAPLVYLSLEGREFGSNDPFASNVEVALGDLIEYRLQLGMALPGVQNKNLSQEPRDNSHGINALSISMLQRTTDHIQVNFATSAVLGGETDLLVRNGWGLGIGAGNGRLSPREASYWNDLLDVRPIHQPGLFTSDHNQTVYTGVFEVVALTGQFGQVTPEWGTSSGAGSHFGKRFIMYKHSYMEPDGTRMPGTEVGSDPLAHFTPLTLTARDVQAVPEPSAMGLFLTAFVGLAWWLRRRRRTGTPPGCLYI